MIQFKKNSSKKKHERKTVIDGQPPVVYCHQILGAVHSKHWSKYAFSKIFVKGFYDVKHTWFYLAN